MASLRDLALQVLARRDVGTLGGTPVEHVEHAPKAFQQGASCSSPVERQKRQNTAKNETCSSVPLSRQWNSGTHAPADCPLHCPRMILTAGECYCDPVRGF